jgi:hypothetical protein
MKVTSITQLLSCLTLPSEGLLAIDGFYGVGKSTVARELATQLGVRAIHLDDYLMRNRGNFVDFLRYSELEQALSHRPLIVEGVCLLAVLDRFNAKPDTLIYVESLESNRIKAGRSSPFAAEVLDYYHRWKPSRVADIIYARHASTKSVIPMESGKADIDVAFIQAKTKIALALAGGGIITLLIGLAVLMYGVTGQDHTLLKGASVEISASGIGGVIMVTSVVWAFFAYKSRPTYSRIHQASEKYDAESRLLERHEHDSSTERATARSSSKHE